MKIKIDWKYIKAEFDTDTIKLLCIPARGKRPFNHDEIDALLCVKDGMNFTIADIHTGDKDSSNALCEEIARRWNEFEEWHECKDDDENPPEIGTDCILRLVYSYDGKEYEATRADFWEEKRGTIGGDKVGVHTCVYMRICVRGQKLLFPF